MRLHRPSLRITPYASRSGVALIITVIMLSVITFLAVAFLALSGREKGAVKTATDQTTARLAADTAFIRAQGELLAGILAAGSVANYNFLVSTNYVNPNGFTNGVASPLNVNYDYLNNGGGALNAAQLVQNIANLVYDPRPPVFITNRLAPPFGSNEFRFYLDLNRNRRLDPTGYLPVTNAAGLLTTNSGYVTGDPQWIGALERPEQVHSSSNKFPYRYTYAAVPVGKTFDVNYVHNQVRSRALNPANDGYFRNQGVGTWEINLAAFLADLNTNQWNPLPTSFQYRQPAFGNSGIAFDDARSILSYRYANDYNSLSNISLLYQGVAPNTLPGAPVFRRDNTDGYSDGPLLMGPTNIDESILTDQDNPDLPWAGAPNVNHLFTTQEFLDPTKTSLPFSNRLAIASASPSTYDQSTYYRLLSQLGTDSAPEDVDKLNLNYINVPPFSSTNFVRWDDSKVATAFGLLQDQVHLVFFTNAANRLLAKYTQEWIDTDANAFINSYKTNQAFGLNSVPVWVSNRFVYTPAVHRLLQLAANLTDTRTNTLWPTIFRPIFTVNNNGEIYITRYEEVRTNNNSQYLSAPIEVSSLSSLPSNTEIATNVYGVPWVVGAKKGLPNFNEISMHSLFQVTRKMQLTRQSLTTPPSQWHTNLMYVVGVSNAVAVEAWNSYRSDFTNSSPVVIRVFGFVRMALTNEFGLPYTYNGVSMTNNLIPLMGISNMTVWKGYGSGNTPNSLSFVVPVRTNISFLPESVYSLSQKKFTTTTNLSTGFEQLSSFGLPNWGLVTSARLQFTMQLGVNGPIIDYVQLDDLGGTRILNEEIRDPDGTPGFEGLWATNIVKNSTLPQGLFNQIDISLGNNGADSVDWKSYDRQSHPTKDFEIDYFRAFCGASPKKYFGLLNTNLVQQVPFTPTKRVLRQLSWQANDPLVHYLAGDLLNIATNNLETPSLSSPVQLLKNIGLINNRYSPWGGNPVNKSDDDPNLHNAAVKDPGVRASDDWQFPTNALPSMGWLGRIHRGTPWQTVYLKASDLNIAQRTVSIGNMGDWLGSYADPAGRWMQWSGNSDPTNSYFTRPVTDRLLFDVFTTSFNENASRGQLSVNQTNLASWSAVFSGVVALTNSFASLSKPPRFDPLIIQPAGVYDAFDPSTWPPLVKLVAGINNERSRSFTNGVAVNYVHPGGWFQSAGDILSVPELTDASPFRNLDTNSVSFQRGVNDVVYEWLPQQVMSLLRLGEPRFVIYAYGQALRPAENSIITATGPFFGMCTNYQITAEVAARAVVRVEGSANPKDAGNTNPKRHYPPHLVVESYNYLPPE